jgi:hypothetical protein
LSVLLRIAEKVGETNFGGPSVRVPTAAEEVFDPDAAIGRIGARTVAIKTGHKQVLLEVYIQAVNTKVAKFVLQDGATQGGWMGDQPCGSPGRRSGGENRPGSRREYRSMRLVELRGAEW